MFVILHRFELEFRDLNWAGLMEEEESEEDEEFVRLNHQPSSLKGGTLKDYQLVGVNWLISLNEIGVNGILADQMGLGKTIQTIAFLAYLMQFKNIRGPHLIIGPATVMGNWMRELNKWLPQLRTVKLLARKEYRYDIFEQYIRPKNFDVIVTSYEAINICIKELRKIQFYYVIVDEAHRLKNELSIFSRNLRSYNTNFKLLLTGTPIQNNIHELWALLNFIMPELFCDSEVFDAHAEPNEGLTEKQMEERNLAYIQSLHRILRPFILKRTKEALRTLLKPKKQVHLYIGLTELQMDLYKKLILKRPLFATERKSYSNILMHLRKCCNHPYLFDGVEPDDAPPEGEHLVTTSSKLTVLDKLLKKLYGNHQVLIFSQFKIMLNILEDYMNMRGYAYSRFDGETLLEEREEAIDEFSKPGSDKFVFLLSTRAGGLGINLMTADTVVLFDSDWNPQVDLQAMDRAHRIGQKNTVMVYRMICENTVEEKIIERQQIKLKWDQLVILKGKISQKKSRYNKEELKDLISFGASEIFRQEGATMKDEDIDVILERGQRRTNQLNEKINQMMEKKKDEILNLEMNSINLYEFMGTDLYDKSEQQLLAERQQAAEIEERKFTKRAGKYTLGDGNNVKMDEEGNVYIEPVKKEVKVNDFHYFKDKARIEEILEKEELTPEEEAEKRVIQDKSFLSWTRSDFNAFIKILEQKDEPDVDALVKKLKKNRSEISRFLKRFIAEKESLIDWKKITERFSRAKKQRRFHEEVERVLLLKLKEVNSPNEVILRSHFYNKIRNKMYQNIHDQHIVFFAGQFGYRNTRAIKRALKRTEIFRFDLFLRHIRENILSKRVSSLMKMILNESKFVLEQKGKQLAGKKINHNVFLMGYKDVFSEGQKHAKQQKEQLRKMVEQQQRAQAEETRRRNELRQRLDRQKEEKQRISRQKAASKLQRVSNQNKAPIFTNQIMNNRPRMNEVRNPRVQNPEPQETHNRPDHFANGGEVPDMNRSDRLKIILGEFINQSIRKMKLRGFTFAPRTRNFGLEELASKFVQINDIREDPELISLLPDFLIQELDKIHQKQKQKTWEPPQPPSQPSLVRPPQPISYRPIYPSNMHSHGMSSEMVQLQNTLPHPIPGNMAMSFGNGMDPRMTSNQLSFPQYEMLPNGGGGGYHRDLPRVLPPSESSPVYVNSINNYNNINNYILRSNGRNPTEPYNEFNPNFVANQYPPQPSNLPIYNQYRVIFLFLY